VVIAVHNQLDYTRNCLESLWKDAPHARVTVVDNASTDGTRAWLRQVAEGNPLLGVIENHENRGVSAAWNQGLTHAASQLRTPDRAVLGVLNNDTLIRSGGMRGLAQSAFRTGISCWHGGRLDPETLAFSGHTRAPAESDYADGCALFFRANVWEKVGSFDEGCFAYSEDADWSLRARSLGYSWEILPDALTHYGSSTSKGMPELGTIQARSHARLLHRWGGKGLGERILVHRGAALGDVIMCTPALAELRRQKPLARIALQTVSVLAAFFQGLEWVDEVCGENLPWEPTVTYDLNRMYEDGDHAGRWQHPALAAAERCGVGLNVGAYHVPATPEEDVWAAKILSGTRGPLVACIVRSAFRPKANWGRERWRELFRARPDLTFVLLDAESRPHLESHGRIDGEWLDTEPNVLDLSGKTPSIRHAVAILRRCQSCVSVDTGLLHAASALNLPTVGLIGGVAGWARVPLASPFRLLQGHADCYPCSNPTHCVRTDGRHCLDWVTGETAASALQGVMR
jgi:GT2 family glycosyltransferase